MPINLSEHQTPLSISPERPIDATQLEDGNQLDFHKSQLERISDARASAFGAATTQSASVFEGAPTPEIVETLTPSQEVLQLGEGVIKLRRRKLDESVIGRE